MLPKNNILKTNKEDKQLTSLFYHVHGDISTKEWQNHNVRNNEITKMTYKTDSFANIVLVGIKTKFVFKQYYLQSHWYISGKCKDITMKPSTPKRGSVSPKEKAQNHPQCIVNEVVSLSPPSSSWLLCTDSTILFSIYLIFSQRYWHFNVICPWSTLYSFTV